MDIKTLQILSAVVRMGSLRKAADSLDISASAASRQIAVLEQELGFALFDRSKRNLTLSDQGNRFSVQCKSVLTQMDALSDLAVNIRRGDAGPVPLAASSGIASALFPPDLATCTAQRFKEHYTLTVADDTCVLDMVRAQTATIGIAAMARLCHATELSFRPFATSTVLLAVSNAHCTPIDAEGLSRMPLIAGAYNARHLDLITQAGLCVDRSNVDTNTLDQALHFVKAGYGAALTDEVACRGKDLAGMRFLPLEPSLTIQYYLVSSRQHMISDACSHFLDMMQSQVGRATGKHHTVR